MGVALISQQVFVSLTTSMRRLSTLQRVSINPANAGFKYDTTRKTFSLKWALFIKERPLLPLLC